MFGRESFFWERMRSGGLRGLQNRCFVARQWEGSTPSRSRHLLEANPRVRKAKPLRGLPSLPRVRATYWRRTLGFVRRSRYEVFRVSLAFGPFELVRLPAGAFGPHQNKNNLKLMRSTPLFIRQTTDTVRVWTPMNSQSSHHPLLLSARLTPWNRTWRLPGQFPFAPTRCRWMTLWRHLFCLSVPYESPAWSGTDP